MLDEGAALYAEKTAQTPEEAQALASVIQNRINSGRKQYARDGSVLNSSDFQGKGKRDYKAYKAGHATGAGARNAADGISYVKAHGPTTDATAFTLLPNGAPPTAEMLHNLGHVVPADPPRIGDIFLFKPAPGYY